MDLSKRKCRNPVGPSPWVPQYPRVFYRKQNGGNFRQNSRKQTTPKRHDAATVEEADNNKRNMRVLLSCFPNIPHRQIVAALILSDNDLLQAVNILQMKGTDFGAKKIKLNFSGEGVLPQKMVFSAFDKGTQTGPHRDFRVFKTAQPEKIIERRPLVSVLKKSIITVENKRKTVAQMPMKTTPTITPVKIVCANGNDWRIRKDNSLFKLPLLPKWRSAKVAKPKTSLPPVPSTSSKFKDMYEFEEEENITSPYAYIKPNRKPLNKVGVIVKKDEEGFTSRLL